MGRAFAITTVFAFLVVSILASSVFAAPEVNLWNVSCVNGVEYALLCNGFCDNPGSIIINHTQICKNHICNNETNSCDSSYNVPTDFFALMIGGLLSIAAMFLIIAIKFPDDWGVVKTLFFISSVILIVAAVGAMGSFFLSSQSAVSSIINTVYLACGFIMFIFIAYIILRWILAFAIKFLRDMEAKKRRIA